jgi:hypothetical protein
MHNQSLQELRDRLHKRIQKLDVENIQLFSSYLNRFWSFYDKQPMLSGIMDILASRYEHVEKGTKMICDGHYDKIPDTEEAAAAFGYSVLRELAKRINVWGNSNDFANHPVRQCSIYFMGKTYPIMGEVKVIRELYLLPFYDYIDEYLEKQRLTIDLLIRYKHRSEWFHRDRLLILQKNNSSKGEKLLALDFYSYLHDQGFGDFSIEPSSISGAIDIIAAQGTENPLLADAKIFKGDKHHICRAFNQIYTYSRQYNESSGYLVIFNITDKDLDFSSLQKISQIPYVSYNHKNIFLITIDLYSHAEPVSQRKPLKSVEIMEKDLIKVIENR